MAEHVTLTTDGFTPDNPPPKEGGPILVRWSCGCTDRVKWVTGLTITHHIPNHRTEFTINR